MKKPIAKVPAPLSASANAINAPGIITPPVEKRSSPSVVVAASDQLSLVDENTEISKAECYIFFLFFAARATREEAQDTATQSPYSSSYL